MKAKIKLGLQYVTMEVKRKENKRKGFMEEVEFAINLKDRQNFRKDRRVRKTTGVPISSKWSNVGGSEGMNTGLKSTKI